MQLGKRDFTFRQALSVPLHHGMVTLHDVELHHQDLRATATALIPARTKQGNPMAEHIDRQVPSSTFQDWLSQHLALVMA